MHKLLTFIRSILIVSFFEQFVPFDQTNFERFHLSSGRSATYRSYSHHVVSDDLLLTVH